MFRECPSQRCQWCCQWYGPHYFREPSLTSAFQHLHLFALVLHLVTESCRGEFTPPRSNAQMLNQWGTVVMYTYPAPQEADSGMGVLHWLLNSQQVGTPVVHTGDLPDGVFLWLISPLTSASGMSSQINCADLNPCFKWRHMSWFLNVWPNECIWELLF